MAAHARQSTRTHYLAPGGPARFRAAAATQAAAGEHPLLALQRPIGSRAVQGRPRSPAAGVLLARAPDRASVVAAAGAGAAGARRRQPWLATGAAWRPAAVLPLSARPRSTR